MKYYSEFIATITVPEGHDAQSIFSVLQKINKEIDLKCPEIFDTAQFDAVESYDFSDSFSPLSVEIRGYLESDDPAKYATTKQFLHMVLRKYKKKHNLSYEIASSKVPKPIVDEDYVLEFQKQSHYSI